VEDEWKRGLVCVNHPTFTIGTCILSACFVFLFVFGPHTPGFDRAPLCPNLRFISSSLRIYLCTPRPFSAWNGACDDMLWTPRCLLRSVPPPADWVSLSYWQIVRKEFRVHRNPCDEIGFSFLDRSFPTFPSFLFAVALFCMDVLMTLLSPDNYLYFLYEYEFPCLVLASYVVLVAFLDPRSPCFPLMPVSQVPRTYRFFFFLFSSAQFLFTSSSYVHDTSIHLFCFHISHSIHLAPILTLTQTQSDLVYSFLTRLPTTTLGAPPHPSVFLFGFCFSRHEKKRYVIVLYTFVCIFR
jgi:hypothetical protein